MLSLFLVTGLNSSSAMAQSLTPDQAFLLKGVHEIGAPGAPGNVVIFGLNAYPVVVGKEGEAISQPVVAAARWGKGRVVIYGHNGYLAPDTHADTELLVLNSLRWAAGAANQTAPIKVGLRRMAGMEKFLRGQTGISVERLDGPGWENRLTGVQVICSDSEIAASESEQKALRQYLLNGGGWVSASTGWGWAQLNPAKSLSSDHHGNHLLMAAGLSWGDGFAGKTTAKGFAAGTPISPLVNASVALDTMLNAKAVIQMNDGALGQAAWSVSQAARMLPFDDKTFLPRLKVLTADAQAAVLPSGKRPLKTRDALARVILTVQIQEAQRALPAQVRAHPAAANFPGSVPVAAKRQANRSVAINTAIPAWHSTGLYAAPGEVIQVTIPEGAADKKFRVRIGCHTDGLWGKDRWSRAPEITVNKTVKQSVTNVASAFGGAIYIDVPAKCDLGLISVRISGGVDAPYFVMGKTSLAEWKNTLRNHPAPWAELASPHVILSVPSEVIRDLDDPEALMKFWDRVVAAQDDLAGTAHDRVRPERIALDEQISAGYMHSGYPIMAHLDVKNTIVNLKELATKGNWGFFHELGHNHQSGDWTFEGTGEVTVNIFSLFTMETVVGQGPGAGHGAVAPDKVQKNILKHLGAGVPYETWKSDPFLALVIYMQLREGFGWETFKRVFAEYRTLPADQRPKTDDQKRDEWMIRFSQAAGKNLGPLFQTWGIPVSTEARKKIAHLPTWLPANFPPKG